MGEHTPTPWQFDEFGHPKSGKQTVVLDGFAIVAGPRQPEAERNSARILACVNAFHNSNIKTERIGTGLIKRMFDVVRQSVVCCTECGGSGTYTCGENYEPCEVCLDARKILDDVGWIEP